MMLHLTTGNGSVAEPGTVIGKGLGVVLAFFGLAFGLSWLIWLPLYWQPASHLQLPYHHAFGALGPMLAAFLVCSYQGRSFRKQLTDSLLKARVSWKWYAIVLLAPAGLGIAALAVDGLMNNHPVSLVGLLTTSELPESGWLGYFIYNVIFFGFGEETGWRGFAMPRLQKSLSPIVAASILAVGWAIWHWPLFLYRPGYLHMDLAGIMGWFLSLLTGSLLLSWLYNGTRGSVLICALFHATIDLAFVNEAMNPQASGILGGLVTVWGLLILLRLRKINTVATTI